MKYLDRLKCNQAFSDDNNYYFLNQISNDISDSAILEIKKLGVCVIREAIIKSYSVALFNHSATYFN